MRFRLLAVGLSGLAMGCAAADSQRKPPEWQPRVDDLGRAQVRMASRLEEMAQAIQLLRDRVEGQERALKEVSRAHEEWLSREENAPVVPVIRVEPLPSGASEVPPAAPPTAEAAPREPAAPESAAPQEAAPERGAEAPSPAADPGPAADLYRRAYSAFREARYGQAILDFEEFLRRHPESDYADNAQYWIGECYFLQSEYGEAVAEFGRVVERYPREAKASDALLRMGLGYERLGEPERARGAWRRVAAEYSGSEAATQARALLESSR